MLEMPSIPRSLLRKIRLFRSVVHPCQHPRDTNKCARDETTKSKEVLYQLGEIMSVNEHPGSDLIEVLGVHLVHHYKGVQLKTTMKKKLDDGIYEIQYINGKQDLLTHDELMKALDMKEEHTDK